MKQMNQQEELEPLRRAGCTALQIRRLCQLKQTYLKYGPDRPTIDLKYLEFMRWLIAHGRLSDDIGEAGHFESIEHIG